MTDDELTVLFAGVLAHGEGEWTAIHDDPNFHALNALSITQLSSNWEWVSSTRTLIRDAVYSKELDGLDQASIAEYLQGYPQPPSESQLSTILESMVARAELNKFGGTYLIPILVQVQRRMQQRGPLTPAGLVGLIRQATEAGLAELASTEALLERARAELARVQTRDAQEDKDSD